MIEFADTGTLISALRAYGMSRISEPLSSSIDLYKSREREKFDALVKFPFTNFHDGGGQGRGGGGWGDHDGYREIFLRKLLMPSCLTGQSGETMGEEWLL